MAFAGALASATGAHPWARAKSHRLSGKVHGKHVAWPRMRFALLGLALVLAGCAGPPQGTAGPDQPRTLTFQKLDGCASHQTTELSVVVNDQAAFEQLWRDSCNGGLGDNGPPAPAVDWTRSSVAASFWGEKPKSGFVMTVLDITEKSDQTVVTVQRTSPSRDCVTAQVVTYPADLVTSAKITKRATFEFHDTEGC
jgi:hypothetical protein